MGSLDPNKAKTARRVIEVLEFFDEHQGQATVMDIARRYNRPQSSTSELLAILVEMGLLYKDPSSRSYMPTPRAALLGSLSQPSVIRDGRMAMTIERLVAQTGLATALFGMVGLNAQIFRWMAGAKPVASALPNGLSGGLHERLSDNAAGWLLLSTIPADRRDGMLHRLRAESPIDAKFSVGALSEKIQESKQTGYAVGPAGFGTQAQMCAVLLPNETGERPLVLSFIHEPSHEIDPAALIALLQRSVQACINYGSVTANLSTDAPMVKAVSSAA